VSDAPLVFVRPVSYGARRLRLRVGLIVVVSWAMLVFLLDRPLALWAGTRLRGLTTVDGAELAIDAVATLLVIAGSALLHDALARRFGHCEAHDDRLEFVRSSDLRLVIAKKDVTDLDATPHGVLVRARVVRRADTSATLRWPGPLLIPTRDAEESARVIALITGARA
jgi:hypothetical protein